MEQATLPTFGWPALTPGPVFLSFEWAGKPPHKGRHRSRLVIPKEVWSYPRDPRAPRYMTQVGVDKIFVQQYPDPDTEKHENAISEFAQLLMNQKHVPPTERPLCLLVVAFRPLLESFSGKQRERALADNIVPDTRPDGDNYLKLAQDALNGIVWKDDSQIVDARVIKRYSDKPALWIEVREMIEP